MSKSVKKELPLLVGNPDYRRGGKLEGAIPEEAKVILTFNLKLLFSTLVGGRPVSDPKTIEACY